MSILRTFGGVARRVGREFFPEHVDIETPSKDWIREDTADILEIRVVDRSGAEPLYGVAAIHGSLSRSPHLEDAVRFELRALAEKMGYTTQRHGEEP